MQTRSKIVFFVVLVCLLLSLAGRWHRRHDSERDNHVRRDRPRVAVRLRRLRTNYSAHHPGCPSLAAVIPPDDEDEDEHRFRLVAGDTRECTLVRHAGPLIAHPFPRSLASPSTLSQPLYRTLCILLI